MYYTSVYFMFLIILICRDSLGSPLYLQLFMNGSKFTPNPKSLEINYDEFEAVKIICSITTETISSSDGVLPTLSWIEDGKEVYTITNEVEITHTKILMNSDDGTELVCKAKSKALDKTWTISAYFHKNKTQQELRNGKLSAFSILLISLGGFIGLSIALILFYAMCQCLRNKRRNKNTADDVQLAAKSDAYAKIDVSRKNRKRSLTKPDESHHYIDTGIDNLSCQIGENTYVNFDSSGMDDVIQKNNSPEEIIVNVSPDINNDGKELGQNIYANEMKNYGNLESSSEC